RRDLRDRPAHRQPRAVPGGTGSLARDAQARRRLVPDLEQPVLAAGQEAPDRTVAILSARDDAHSGAGAYGGILRPRRARRHRRDRRPNRLAGCPRASAGPPESRGRDESDEDRRGLLLPAYAGQILLDARAAADALFDEAELLRAPSPLPKG